MTATVPAGEQQEIQYTNDILAMISPENEKVSLGKVLDTVHSDNFSKTHVRSSTCI